MRTAQTGTSLDKVIVIDVLITELTETVAAGLVLYQAAEIVGIDILAHRAAGDHRAVAPHVGDSTVIGRIFDQRNQRSVDPILGDSRSLAGIFEADLFVRSNTSKRIGRTEFRLPDGVHISHPTIGREAEDGVDIEIVAISLVGLHSEEVTDGFIYGIEVFALGDILGIEAVAHEYQVDTGALRCRLHGQHLAIPIFVVVLLDFGPGPVVLSIEQEDHLAFAGSGPLGLVSHRDGHLDLARSAHRFNRHPVGFGLHTPRLSARSA